tara:strand:- start:653 stop:820 length:168 start_codon:yes stop_codon:yes gene_type:complete
MNEQKSIIEYLPNTDNNFSFVDSLTNDVYHFLEVNFDDRIYHITKVERRGLVENG